VGRARGGARRPGATRPVAAGGAGRVAGDGHAQEAHGEGVDHEQATDERLADAEEELERLGRLEGADQPGEDAEHAGVGAARDQAGRRRLGVEAAVARAVGRREHRHLPLEPVDAAVDVGRAEGDAGVVDGIAGGEVVGAVDHEGVVGGEGAGVGRGEPRPVARDPDVRVEVGEPVGGGIDLVAPDCRGAVKKLPVEVGGVDVVVVDQAEGADARRRQVEGDRGAEPAGADDEHAGVAEAALPRVADVGKDELPGVAGALVGGERGRGGHGRWARAAAAASAGRSATPATRAAHAVTTPRIESETA
jgi:hypothetical protein